MYAIQKFKSYDIILYKAHFSYQDPWFQSPKVVVIEKLNSEEITEIFKIIIYT